MMVHPVPPSRHAQPPRRAGATLVETAIVLSGTLLLMFAIFEYGRYFMVRHVVDNAAREGARLASPANIADTNSFNYQTEAAIRARVVTALAGVDRILTGTSIQIYQADTNGNSVGTYNGATTGENVAVQVSATYTPMLPGFRLPFFKTWIGLMPSTVTIQTKSVMFGEGN